MIKITYKYILLISLFSIQLYGNNYGSLLFHGNCTTCHYETRAISAPSMIEVRKKYLNAFSKKKDFVKYMSEWVHNPQEETSIMLGAVKKYELMPHLHFDMQSLKEITSYIYETNFDKKHKGHSNR